MTLTSREASRMFTCPPVVGCCVGVIAGAVTVITSDGAGLALAGVLPAIVLGAIYGAPLGCLLGLVLGVPIAVVAGLLRPVLSAWRAVGSGLAGVASGGGVASVTSLAGADALLPVVTATAAAVGAWIGLGRIYGRAS